MSDEMKLSERVRPDVDELIVDCIYSKGHESDPRKALAEAIARNVKVALDPTVSKEACDMQQAAIDAALENVRAWLEFRQDWYASHEGMKYPENKTDAETAYRDAEYHVSTLINTNPLAEAQARIADLDLQLAKAKDDLRHMGQCYLDAKNEIAQLRGDLYREIGSTSS